MARTERPHGRSNCLRGDERWKLPDWLALTSNGQLQNESGQMSRVSSSQRKGAPRRTDKIRERDIDDRRFWAAASRQTVIVCAVCGV